jgi:hypothetical protein
MPRTRKTSSAAPPRPLSPERLAANRANAARSTGPRTSEGKTRSAQNARKHGFTATNFAVVRLEDLHAVARLRADLIAVYQPVNSQELFALERMAIAQQAILRAARLESGLFTTCLNETLDSRDIPYFPMNDVMAGPDIEITLGQNRNYCLGEGFLRIVRQSNAWTLALRYQAQAERQYRRALEEFERLKRLRAELPNEPIVDTEPIPDKTDYTQSETARIEPSRPLRVFEIADGRPPPPAAPAGESPKPPHPQPPPQPSAAPPPSTGTVLHGPRSAPPPHPPAKPPDPSGRAA